MNTKFIEDIYRDADLYDMEFRERSHELPLLMKLASGASSILEVACGTGRLSLPLAQAGHAVSGLDICSTLVMKARSKATLAETEIDFYVEDARSFRHQQKYDLIVFVANALQHLVEADDALVALENCRVHLQSGGYLLLEVMMPDAAKLSQPDGHRKLHKQIRTGEGAMLEVWRTIRHDPILQILHLQLDYLQEAVLISQKVIKMRMFYPQEIRQLLQRAGLKVVRAWGGYDGSDLTASSPSQLLLCSACTE